MKRLIGFFVSSALSAAMIVGCEDSGTQPKVTPAAHISGTVFALDSSLPVEAKVALVDGRRFTVVAGPVTTDANGRYELSRVPTGTFYLFVFTDEHLALEPSSVWVTLTAGEKLERNIGLIPAELWDNDGPQVVGKVTDAATGTPVNGAFVSGLPLGFLSFRFVGVLTAYDCVTGVDGTYEISMGFVTKLQGDTMWAPVAVSAEGYDSFASSGFDISGSLDTVVTLDIQLTRGGPSGAVRGRVTLDDNPVAGVAVGLDYFPDPPWLPPNSNKAGAGEPERVPVQGKTATTETDGTFLISGLAPGEYTVNVAYLPNDGYATTTTGGEVVAGEVLDVGDVPLLRTFEGISPQRGAEITDTIPTFVWRSVAGVTRYTLALTRGHLFERHLGAGADTVFVLPDTLAFSPGDHVRWSVSAYRDFSGMIAIFESDRSFTVVAPPVR